MASARHDTSQVSELEQLRLENETLSGIVGVVTSGPDLAHILDRVVDLLTRATDSHACFVYLPAGDRLVLRAASPVYAHLVGKIAFGVDEGLAGWAMRRREAAFIREGAIEDPRTIYIPELEEERFQSMVAVPVPSRAGESIGVIILHTVAPREFDEGTLNVLSRAASLVAGAIENARLYETAQERVEALTELSAFGRQIAAESDRTSLHRVAATGLRALLEADVCRLYEFEGGGSDLKMVAAFPEADPVDEADEAAAVMELLEEGGISNESLRLRLAKLLGLGDSPTVASAVSLIAGAQRVGVLLAASVGPWEEVRQELLRAASQQIGLAMEKVYLIERLTEENLARDLFGALATGDLDLAAEKMVAAGLEPELPHVVLEARVREGAEDRNGAERIESAERTVRRTLPGAFCHRKASSLRGIAPSQSDGPDAARALSLRLASVAETEDLAIGVSDARRGLAGLRRGLQEATDAASVALGVLERGGILLYRDTGAYRYLLGLLDSGGPDDHLRAAVEVLAAYDRERGSQLVLTLDEYLSHGRSASTTARALFVHANTLRQRLSRIETLTGLSLQEEDLLALQLAVRLARLRAR